MCQKCKSPKEDSIICENFGIVNVCQKCKDAIEAACATNLERDRRRWENHKIIGHRYARFSSSEWSGCIVVEFDNNTGIAVIQPGKGQYASSQRAPENPDVEKMYAAVYAAKSEHEQKFNSEFNTRADCTGAYPTVKFSG